METCEMYSCTEQAAWRVRFNFSDQWDPYSGGDWFAVFCHAHAAEKITEEVEGIGELRGLERIHG